MVNEARKQIFLSHAGQDAEFARRLAARIECEWTRRQTAHEAHVFCTSEPQYRFKDLKQVLRPGSFWRRQVSEWEEELRQYLRQNLIGSAAYVLLVTKQSLEKHSTWIAFEIDVASEQTKERQQSFFYPCVAEGATFGELPEKAIRFQAIDLGSDTELDSAEGLAKIRELVTAMIENSNNISPSPIAPVFLRKKAVPLP